MSVRDNSKLYRSKAKKASKKKTTQKAVSAAKKRREMALGAFTVQELLLHFVLVDGDKFQCPGCKSFSLEEAGTTFCCSNCKQQGNAIKFVKIALNGTDWQAIKYIEKLRESNVANKVVAEVEEKSIVAVKETSAQLQPDITIQYPPQITEQRESVDKERIQQIKERTKISDVIQTYADVIFKRVGTNTLCRCPFPDHEDKTPSCSVDDAKGLFHCFGCGRKGDVISFLQQYKNCSFREALSYLDPQTSLAKTSSIAIEAVVAASPLLKRCTQIFHSILAENKAAQEFLLLRGLFDSEMVRYFEIGFDDGKINQMLTEQNKTALKEIGFLSEKNKCRFYRCLTIPLHDKDNNIVSIYGRRIKAENGSKHQFAKGNMSGLFHPRAFSTNKEIIITEGIIDGLSVWTMGHKNVTSIFSATTIPEMLIDLLLSNGIEKIYLALDNDKKGTEACERIAAKLSSFPIELLRISFPENIKDGNELLVLYGKEKAKDVFNHLVYKAKPLPKTKSQTKTSIKSGKLNIDWKGKYGRASGLLEYEIELLARERAALKILVIASHNRVSHTDKLDLLRSQNRGAFANIAARRFNVASEQIENELEEILLYLRKLPKEALGQSKSFDEYVTTYTQEEKQEALAWLQQPDFFEQIPTDYDFAGYVGENEAKQVAYLCASSRKMESPLPLIIRATSAGGKSALMETTAKLMPDEDVLYLSELSKQALYYMTTERIQHKLVIVDERKGSEEADYAIRTLLSRGLLRKAVPTREIDGEIRTIIRELNGPIGYMESTTSEYIHPENENRCFSFYLDDSAEQSKRIHRMQRLYFTPEGREKRRLAQQIIRKHKVAQKLLRPCKVDIPYVHHLTFPTTWCRTRRDHQKFLSLLSTITYLHQYQRKTYTEKQELIVISQLQDYEIAYKLAPLVLRPSVSDLTEKHHELLEGIDTYLTEKAQKEQRAKQDIVFTRSEIVRTMKWQIHQIKSYLPKLVEMEYLVVIGSAVKGATHKYLRNYEIPDETNPLTWLITPQQLTEKTKIEVEVKRK